MVIDATEARYGHRWWKLTDLATTDETVRPANMTALLPAVLAGIGSEPLHLGDFDEDPDEARI